jgi:uncharacterized protein (TIGR02246 family)
VTGVKIEVHMMLKPTAFLFALLLAGFSIADAEPKGDEVREARTAIEAANSRFSDAFARGDIQAVASMYTSDAILFPPDSDVVRGNQAIGEFWKATRDSGVRSAALTTDDVGRSGDLAYESGKVSLTIQPEGKEATNAVAKYVVVWKRESDGAWKLHRDIWNDLPAAK